MVMKQVTPTATKKSAKGQGTPLGFILHDGKNEQSAISYPTRKARSKARSMMGNAKRWFTEFAEVEKGAPKPLPPE